MTHPRSRPLWAFAGLFGFLTFPAIGSAIAHPDGNRRLAQAVVLLISVGLLAPALRAVRVSAKQLGLVALLAALPLLPSVFRAAEAPSSISSYSVSLLLVGWLWTGLGLLAITVRSAFMATGEEPPEPSCSLLVAALGVGIVLKTWWVGSPDANVFVTFGGHTNSVATLGVLGLCWTALIAPWKHLIVAAPAYAYLLLFSTSRAGFVALAVAWVALVAAAGAKYHLDRSRAGLLRTVSRTLIVPACCLGVILPMLLGPSALYPYRSLNRADLVVPRYEDFWGRMSRFSRLLPASQRETLFAGLKLLHDVIAERFGEAPWWQILTERSIQPENRPFLVKEAWSESTVTVLGRWPVPYSSYGLSYPHNHGLDMAYNFGWLPATLSQLAVFMAILAAGSALAARASRAYAAMAFLGVLVSAVKVQFAGDLVDSMPLLLVCVIALALESPSGPSEGRPGRLLRRLTGRGVS